MFTRERWRLAEDVAEVGTLRPHHPLPGLHHGGPGLAGRLVALGQEVVEQLEQLVRDEAPVVVVCK